MKINFSITGKSELNASLERQRLGFIQATKRAVRVEAEAIMQDSIPQVPVETRSLRDSAFVDQNTDGSVTFGYGKGAVNSKSGKAVEDYMVAVHERLDVYHPHGKAKFLEDPVNAHAHKLESSVASKIRSFLGI